MANTWDASCNAAVSNIFLGDHIGTGTFRSVYEHALDKKLVIKLKRGDLQPRDFSNALEWEFWYHVKDHDAARFFAPCIAISETGNALVQRRCYAITSKQRMPTKIPAICNDMKMSNWGVLDGRVVCHDYGLLDYKCGSAPLKLVPHVWMRNYDE